VQTARPTIVCRLFGWLRLRPRWPLVDPDMLPAAAGLKRFALLCSFLRLAVPIASHVPHSCGVARRTVEPAGHAFSDVGLARCL